MNIEPAKASDASVLIYEYGCRVDKECQAVVWEQIRKSRALYNTLVATIRRIVDESNAYILAQAGEDAKALSDESAALTMKFAEAKAADDEPTLKTIAQARRLKWRELGDKLKATRKAFRKHVQDNYLNRIGKNSSCETYRLRNEAVADGLGWATANAILDAALIAFKKSFVQGRTPRFASGEEKDQDCLTLQFTAAGGIPSASLLAGTHGEFALIPPDGGARRRRYGEFKFRLGAAKAETYCTGTWQYHRPLPEGLSVGLVRLVRRRIGKDYRYALQLMVKLAAPLDGSAVAERKPLATVHFGWAYDLDGRRVAGIADSADPGAAHLLRLPPSIEETLKAAAGIQAERDTARNEIMPQLKAAVSLPDGVDPTLAEEWQAFRRLPVSHMSANRLLRLCWKLREAGVPLPDWVETWRKEDRLRWQAHTHMARRARNSRKGFYRGQAVQLARTYSAIAIEPLDLKEAALKVNEVTGEKTDLSRKARAGRVVAAIYELESAIRWAAVKHGCAVLDIVGKTASHCSMCGGVIAADDEDIQVLHCDACGAELDRKQNGAAYAWQAAHDVYEKAVAEYWLRFQEERRAKAEENASKKLKLIEGRAKARSTKSEQLPESPSEETVTTDGAD